MTNILCDICKRPIPEAIRSYSWATRFDRYDTLKDKDFCVDCQTVLEKAVDEELAKNEDYRFVDQKRILNQKLEELCAWDEAERDKVLGYE